MYEDHGDEGDFECACCGKLEDMNDMDYCYQCGCDFCSDCMVDGVCEYCQEDE